jgi:hypothetical protein
MSISNYHIETAGRGDYELFKLFVSVPPATFSSRHIIEIIDPFDIKRNMVMRFNKAKVATRIRNFRKIDETA